MSIDVTDVIVLSRSRTNYQSKRRISPDSVTIELNTHRLCRVRGMNLTPCTFERKSAYGTRQRTI